MKKATQMGVDVERFMRTRHNVGDTFMEVFKNGEEAAKKVVRATLDRVAKILVVENDGAPIPTIDEVERLLFTLFTTGKVDDLNFGTGFSTILKEKFTIVETADIEARISSWKSIEMEDGHLPRVEGMRVTIHLEDNSEILAKPDDYYLALIGSFVSDKELYFNGERVMTAKLDQSDMVEVYKGVKAKMSLTAHHYFTLSSGSLAPVKLHNIASQPCTVIVSSISVVDTERSNLSWSAQWELERWVKKRLAEEMKALREIPPEALEWVGKFCDFFSAVVKKASGKDVVPDLKSLSLHDIPIMIAWQKTLNFICKQFDIEQFEEIVTVGPRYKDIMDESASPYVMRAFASATFGLKPNIMFADAIIGIMIADGKVDGNACVRDLSLVHGRVANVTYSSTWDGIFLEIDPYVAYYIEPSPFAEVDSVDVKAEARKKGKLTSAEKADPKAAIESADKSKLDGLTPPESPLEAKQQFEQLVEKAKIAARERADKDDDDSDPDEIAQDNAEVVPEWRFLMLNDNIPCIIHSSIEDMDTEQFNYRVQLNKWRNWVKVTKLVLDYTGKLFTTSCVPVLMITNDNNRVLSMKLNEYVALNRFKTKLPNTKIRAGLYLLQLALHELAHFRYKAHDKDFYTLVEDTFLELLKHETFMHDLTASIELL